jgi:hypothetical protein
MATSQIERHVGAVRAKLTMHRFVEAIGWTLLVSAGVVLAAVVVHRLIQFAPPRPAYWLYGVLGAALVAAIVMAVLRRPTPHEAAVAIDEKLGLKERFSTALTIRNDADPFARAAVLDAENTARSANLAGKFPMPYPKVWNATLSVAAAAALTFLLMPTFDLFNKQEEAKRALEQQARVEAVKKDLDARIRALDQIPPSVAAKVGSEEAKKVLAELRNQPGLDPEAAQRRASEALAQVEKAVQEQIKNNANMAQAADAQRQFQSGLKAPTEDGPVAEAHKAMKDGNFDKAIQDLQQLGEKFPEMTEAEKEKAAKQMEQLAQQLQNMANDPAQQQRQEQQLQQMGFNQQQIQQAQQMLQQAANGDQQAQQQLQQMAQQAMQQMNNGQGPTPQQQQQLQQMMQQMQAGAANQQAAQQMAQAAQQMAQAMQQAAQGQNPGQGQGGQQGQQGMANAQQQMQQALDALDAARKDAQAMQQAAGACQGGGQGGEGGQPGGKKDGQGQWAQGDPKGQGAGMGGPGIGNGGRANVEQAPFGTKAEKSPSQDQESGQVLARTFVRDRKIIRGESTAQVTAAARAAEEQASDEVDQERVSRQAARSVKNYFDSLGGNPGAAPAPAPQPK